MTGIRCALLVAFAIAIASPVLAEPRIVLPRAGQVGIGVQGGYGLLLKNGAIGETFGAGESYTVRLRYRMRYERGLGLTFENNSFDARTEVPYTGEPSTAPRKLGVILSGLEFYQMFNTRTRNVSMLSLGAGLVQQRVKLNSGETELSGTFSGDGFFLSAGAGVERFVYRSIAIDLSTRYYAMFREGKPGHNLQVALGAIFYAGY